MFNTSPRNRKIEISGTVSDAIIANALRKAQTVFIIKAIIATIVILAGCYFIYLGIESSAVIKLKYNGLDLELNKALPGVTLIIFGIILLIFSNSKIKVNKT